MSTNHLILCRPLLLLISIFLSTRVCSNELALHIRWPKYWSFSFSISPSNAYSGLIFFRIDWFDPLVVQGTLKSLLISWLYTLLKKTSPKTVLRNTRGFPGGSDGKESACNAEDLGSSLSWEDPLEEGMATHFSILDWRIPTDREAWWAAGQLRWMGHNWATKHLQFWKKHRAWTTHQRCSDQPGVN